MQYKELQNYFISSRFHYRYPLRKHCIYSSSLEKSMEFNMEITVLQSIILQRYNKNKSKKKIMYWTCTRQVPLYSYVRKNEPVSKYVHFYIRISRAGGFRRWNYMREIRMFHLRWNHERGKSSFHLCTYLPWKTSPWTTSYLLKSSAILSSY